MGIEIRPFKDACNIRCTYCYQEGTRSSGNISKSYDLEKIKTAILRERQPFTLFGGEPLLMPLEDLEELWSLGYEKYGNNSVQTNATLINDNHIVLFKKYNVSVGISIDGPDELNDVRWSKNLTHTRQLTAKIEETILQLRKELIQVSIIITIHKKNAINDKLVKLIEWVKGLHEKGIRSIRVHTLEVNNESVRKDISLSENENFTALLAFAKLKITLSDLEIDVLDEMEMLLRGDDSKVSCVWYSCDPYTTAAVTGINGDGQYSNCGRTNKDGVDMVKSEKHGHERQIALYFTPQDAGGCKDCRFFLCAKVIVQALPWDMIGVIAQRIVVFLNNYLVISRREL
ncbi:MAG: radical SAM protein [Bacteroidetes bacterium]|nr:radical SAM protein [Bacteroidota bacterium]